MEDKAEPARIYRWKVSVRMGEGRLRRERLVGFEMEVWFGVWAPAATARPVLQKLANDIRAAMATPEVREQYAKLGIEAGTLFLGDFSRFVRGEMAKYEKVVKRAEIQPM